MELDYGASLGFASVGSNAGHDGDSLDATPLANNSEVLADFSSRAVHVASVVGKEILSSYYGQEQNSSYYLGCSQGGRQGMYEALHYPEDFDGILAGAPAVNFNNLLGGIAMFAKYLGAPNRNASASYISPDLWTVVANQVLEQCDELDGVIDGIITEPDACDFRPEELLCVDGGTEDCLSAEQVEALRRLYSPLYGLKGEFLYPRYDPGAELSSGSPSSALVGEYYTIATVSNLWHEMKRYIY